ncbi:MAG: hypothetical protein IJE12_08515 [Prevotella sp.]|nr:hypothetical protein [Prevotella sp.]
MKKVKNPISPILLVLLFLVQLTSCLPTKKLVPLSEFNHYVDSVSQTNGCEIFVEYNSFKNYSLSRESLPKEVKRLARFANKPTGCYKVKLVDDDGMMLAYSPALTKEEVVKRYEKKEELRKHRKNRVSKKEFRDSLQRINAENYEVDWKRWKKMKMLRSEMKSELNLIRRGAGQKQ